MLSLLSRLLMRLGKFVARHWAERIIYEWLPQPLKLPFTRRAERDADHIGIMLLGAAGFDPCAAPRALEKFGDSKRGFLNTHPSCKKRSQLLSQSKIMGEALELYREFNPGQDSTEGSL
ncbi:hypothetical protein BRADI_1g22126v3 [Brachypodium distachyon]|uniref:Peptidase M48 domain-containing protein n=1 Tax=Brachypodium distachyon TaxID=15368 RepID=A0A2K2DKJ5_BRADI|nr:hypothetical protein BRADI_1g22126v3 [Brachypodium distachyon]PNT74799.1 hypothetical protein BRADI_1g22126v3 [Brachypodium distachyon]